MKGSICVVTKHLVLTCPPPLPGVVFWAIETSKRPSDTAVHSSLFSFSHRPVTCEQSHPYNPCASSSLSLILVLFPKMHTGNECPCSASAMLHWAWATWLLLTTRVPCMQETGAGCWECGSGSEQPSPDVWRQPAQAWSCCPGQCLLSMGCRDSANVQVWQDREMRCSSVGCGRVIAT